MNNRLLSNPLRLATVLMFVSASFAQTSDAAGRLRIVDDRISIHVVDGSVVELAEELGRLRGFEVIAQDVKDARVTLDVEGLTSIEAIRAICKPIGFIAVPDPATGETARLVLVPAKATAKNRLEPRREPLAPRPKGPVELPPEQDVPVQDPPDEKPIKRND